MPYIALENRQINFKVVYCGPGRSGKTTNLAWLHRALAPEKRGELLMLNTREDRTLFFDFFPMDLGKVNGFSIRFHMYTVPGQSYYQASRRLVLEGADAAVFVADSHPERMEENLASFRQMQQAHTGHGAAIAKFPIVLQYNKRDCANPVPVGCLERQLGIAAAPVVAAVACRGEGVMETARYATQMVISRFRF